MIVKTLETTPPGETHWSTRSMAKAAGFEPHDDRPHLADLSPATASHRVVQALARSATRRQDPRCRRAVYRIRRRMRSCSPSTRSRRSKRSNARSPILPMDIGQPERRTHNYIRKGRSISSRRSTSPRARSSPGARPSIARRTSSPFCARLRRASSRRLDIHVVLDNLSAHKAPPVQRWLLRHPRVQFHFTPTYASWLNLVERFFGLLTEKALETWIAHEHCATARGHPGLRRRPQRPRHALQMGQNRRRDPRQHATIRPSRAAGPWSMTLILEITDPGD